MKRNGPSRFEFDGKSVETETTNDQNLTNGEKAINASVR